MNFLLSLFPGRIYIYLAVLAGSFTAGGLAAWKVQNWRIAEREAQHAEQELADVRSNSATALRRADAVITAQSAASARLGGLRRDAAAAVSELDSLRTQSADALRTAATSLDACTAYGATANQLLLACGTRYSVVAAEADLWANDAKTLIEAWPK